MAFNFLALAKMAEPTRAVPESSFYGGADETERDSHSSLNTGPSFGAAKYTGERASVFAIFAFCRYRWKNKLAFIHGHIRRISEEETGGSKQDCCRATSRPQMAASPWDDNVVFFRLKNALEFSSLFPGYLHVFSFEEKNTSVEEGSTRKYLVTR